MICKFILEKISFDLFFFPNRRTEILPPLNYVYYTWMDPLKARELTISCGSKSTKLELNVRNLFLI